MAEVLPTVKCSSCGLPVPLASLGDHVCPPLPPPNILSLQKPPMSPKSVATLLPQRLQSLVARSDALPRKSSSEKLSEEREPVLAPSRDPLQRLPPDKSNMATNVPFPKSSPPSLDRSPGAPTPPPPPPERVPTPVRDAIPPALQRVRFASHASHIAPISPARTAFPIQLGESAGRPIPLSPARRDHPPRPPSTDRASSNATPPSGIRPRPSFERTRTPSTHSTSRPTLGKSPPSLDTLRPSLDARRPSPDQNPPAPPGAPFARPPRTAVPAPGPGTVPFPSSTPVLPPALSARRPPPPPLSPAYSRAHVPMDREIDTKIGGEAGMAGVGRRGFAAAARAAMFAASRSPFHQPAHVTTLGDSHRANVPQYLDTSAIFSHVMRGKSVI
jgi:hypothetical protein